MTLGTDRRSVLTGLGALGVMGCGGPVPDQQVADAAGETAILPLDLSALEARYGGRLGLAVMDSTDGRRYAYRGEERFIYCSTFKLFLAAATLDRVARGEERLARPVPVTVADMLSHAPISENAVGGTLTIERLCQAAVEQSDNPAANILIRELGGLEAMRAFYRGIGDQGTRVDRLEPEMNRPDGDMDTTTPLQAVQNIDRVFSGSALGVRRAHQRLLENWMVASPTGAGRIKAGAPAGWIVAHKTGTGAAGPTNDIGFLRHPSGQKVPLAIYYHATSASTPAQRDAVIADAARLALKALGHD